MLPMHWGRAAFVLVWFLLTLTSVAVAVNYGRRARREIETQRRNTEKLRRNTITLDLMCAVMVAWARTLPPSTEFRLEIMRLIDEYQATRYAPPQAEGGRGSRGQSGPKQGGSLWG